MTREQVVRLAVLTACIFGFSIYMQKGTWVFPFPMYELSLLGALIALYFIDKKPGIIGFFAFTWGLLQLSTSQFALEFFFDDNDFNRFYDSAIPDFLLLGFVVVFLVWGILISLALHKKSLRISGIIACIIFVCSFFASTLIDHVFLWAMIPLVGWLILLMIDEKEGTIHRNILFLFTFFFISKHLTLFWMGG